MDQNDQTLAELQCEISGRRCAVRCLLTSHSEIVVLAFDLDSSVEYPVMVPLVEAEELIGPLTEAHGIPALLNLLELEPIGPDGFRLFIRGAGGAPFSSSPGSPARKNASPAVDQFDEEFEHLRGRLPRSYLCPISGDLMVDPVLCADFHAYERYAIEKWLEYSQISPMSGEPLPFVHLTADDKLRRRIQTHIPHVLERVVQYRNDEIEIWHSHVVDRIKSIKTEWYAKNPPQLPTNRPASALGPPAAASALARRALALEKDDLVSEGEVAVIQNPTKVPPKDGPMAERCGDIVFFNGAFSAHLHAGRDGLIAQLPPGLRPHQKSYFVGSFLPQGGTRLVSVELWITQSGRLYGRPHCESLIGQVIIQSITLVAAPNTSPLEMDKHVLPSVSTDPPSFLKVGHLVVLSGGLTVAVQGEEDVLVTTLPARLTPAYNADFLVSTQSNYGPQRLRVLTDGSMWWMKNRDDGPPIDATELWMSLVGVSFQVSD
mmetsp:Transcript_31459/g.76573  ORF Transcript_31459/g.76573 Transcript_31459/m.76573 type:complete len:489 (+) Transcript_31459:60-1526(+)